MNRDRDGGAASSSNPQGGTTSGTPRPANAAGSTQTIGGMTLKKRAPGTPAPASAPTTGGAPTPRPSGGYQGGTGGGGQFPRPAVNTNVQKRMERFSRVMPTRDPGVRMNEQIRAAEIRVIDDEGQVGVMSPREALEIAREREVDLIEIVPNAQPPVCKLIDFGKWKYEQQKRDKMAKKTSHQQLLKEVRFHPNTDTHDFDFKVRHARNFLGEGHKVKASVQFKGREIAYKQFGEELLRKFQEQLTDISKVDQDISMMGKTMSMTFSPTGKRKKDEVKGEAKPNGASKKEGKKKGSSEETASDEAVLSENETSELETSEAATPVVELPKLPDLPEGDLLDDDEDEEDDEPLVDDTTGLE